MEVEGYKIFNSDFTNRYGIKFELGKIYIAEKPIKFGTQGNGFHLCKNVEDTFRYFDTFKKDFIMCKVEGSGDIVKKDDEYYGYYDMYSVEKIKLLEVLSREEIIITGLNLNDFRAERFVSGLKLNKNEIKEFQTKYKRSKRVIQAIEYYQLGNKEIYEEGVKIYGQYNNKRST